MDNAAADLKSINSSMAGLNVMIIGAGLAGSLQACFLARRGANVSIYERRPDPRVHGFLGGRSINLALSTRGIYALQQVGLAEQVLADAVPMRGRMLHSPTGDLRYQPYSSNPTDAINSVSRGGLNVTLLNAAESYQNVSLHFVSRCTDIDLERPGATFINDATGESESITADLIIGADGAFSAVRDKLAHTDRFSYEQDYLDYGYKELIIPATADGKFAMEPNALHIWPRGGYMMIALPNADRSYTCTCFWPYDGPHGFDRLQRDEQILQYFLHEFPDAAAIMPTLAADYRANPTGSLVTIRCWPWNLGGRILLIGDAAHSVVPFYGQGMNAAFEDCTILDACIERLAPDWPDVLDAFARQRKPSVDALADLALDNFIEMRDRVKSRWFLLAKKFEQTLHGIAPRWYIPLYNTISFSRIPYEKAWRRACRQNNVIFRVVPFFLAMLSGLVGLLLLLIFMVQ